MQRIVSVNPFRCRMWEHHDRLEECINEDNCKAEISSFMTHGQQIPVLGRAVRGDSSHDAELIFGARRLFVARHLNLPLKVELRELTDREAFIVMDIENRQRKDISAYERGLSYARCLRSEHFRSQDDVARAFSISAAQVSRCLKVAGLPTVIVAAFRTAADLRETWALDLYDAWQIPERRRQLADTARQIAKLEQRPPAEQIYRTLMNGLRLQSRVALTRKDDVIKNKAGKPMFRVRKTRDSVALIVPAQAASGLTLEMLKKAVADVLHDANREVPDSKEICSDDPGDSRDPSGREQ